jgi:hypothetical protein
VAGALWNVGAIAGFAASAAVWRKALREERRFDPTDLLLFAATVALGQSFFLELFFGQVDLWMLALLSAPLSAAGRRPAFTGLTVALACLLKPTAGLVVVALLAAKRFRAIGFVLAWGALLHLPLLLRYGWSGAAVEMSAWVATLDRTTAPMVLGHNPQGLPTLLLGLFSPANFVPGRAALAAAEIGSAAAFAVASVWLLRGTALWAALCFGAVLVSPLAWRANFVLAWPFLLGIVSLRPRSWMALAAAGAVAAVEGVVLESLVGIPQAQAVLATRIWAVAFLALAAVGFAVLSRRGPAAAAAV